MPDEMWKGLRFRLRIARILTSVTVVLVAVASAVGLFVSGLYRDNAWVTPQNQGTDLVTLAVVVPCLILAMRSAGKGSSRGTIAWFGLLGYVCYIYTGAAFAYAFNAAFLLYVVLFSLSIASLVALATRIDVVQIQGHFDDRTPVRPVAVFMALIAFMLCVLWIGQIVPFFINGTVPAGITQAGAQTSFIYVLDLGVVVPLALLGAVLLWLRRPWGVVIAGFVLVKAASMGLALLAMTWFLSRSGQPVDGMLSIVWLFLATSAIGMTLWFLRHCHCE
ncbi:MAG: hypothetical protein E4G93_03690 [Dehalococcoidia bacterium]|nr:MAG: hypothetical protein E4G93_03690 [Dehalococcoidia bacterium]